MSIAIFAAEKPKGEAPVITSKLKQVEITEGEDVVLVCEFSGKPGPTCEWSKDGLTLKPDGRIRIKVTDTSSTITIKESTLEDEGHYKCTVRNEFGSGTTSTEVLVNEKQEGAGPRIVEKLKDIAAVLGQKVKFSIRVSGTAEVDWFRNEELVEDSGRFIVVDNENEGLFELEIEDVHPEDIGTYKCVVFNESGEVSSTARLRIQEGITPEGVDETESAPLKGKCSLINIFQSKCDCFQSNYDLKLLLKYSVKMFQVFSLYHSYYRVICLQVDV